MTAEDRLKFGSLNLCLKKIEVVVALTSKEGFELIFYFLPTFVKILGKQGQKVNRLNVYGFENSWEFPFFPNIMSTIVELSVARYLSKKEVKRVGVKLRSECKKDRK